MQHYWGAKAICERIGYQTSNRILDLILRYHLPAYKRFHPKKKCVRVYYSNEALLSKWDLARVQHDREELMREREERAKSRAEKQKYGPRGIRKTPSHGPNA